MTFKFNVPALAPKAALVPAANVVIEGKARELCDMLSFRRPAGSKTERRFISQYLIPLDMSSDGAGNLVKRIGTDPVLWSCHTDTVHKAGGVQRLATVGTNVVVSSKETQSNCLGADDTAGVWLMAEMIRAKKPGLYIFHRGEEIGGKGSEHIAKHAPETLDGIKAAIALDRRGKNSVITHQCGRTCSDLFANSLAALLGDGFRPDSTGIFTDTANYTGLIGECSNLSVGYQSEHSKSESLDLPFILGLRDKLIDLDTSKIAFSRMAGEVDPRDNDWSSGGIYSDYEWDKYPSGRSNGKAHGYADDYGDDHSTMLRMVRDYPNEVADVLEDYGIDARALWDDIVQRGGGLG
jgi:Peptidase family M28